MSLTHCGSGCAWDQRGNQTGHCSACHRTFDSVGAFDAHQEVCASGVTCLDPAAVKRTDGTYKFEPRFGDPHSTMYWRLAPTDKQRAWLEERSRSTV